MVKVKREQIVTVVDNNGMEIKSGRAYVIKALGYVYIGAFMEVTKKGALKFCFDGTEFSLMPGSIDEVVLLKDIVKTMEV